MSELAKAYHEIFLLQHRNVILSAENQALFNSVLALSEKYAKLYARFESQISASKHEPQDLPE